MTRLEAPDTAEVTIERVFLWNEATELFRDNAFIAGVQAPLEDGTKTNIVLAGELIDDSNTKQRVELWARWAGGIGIHEISIVFDDPHTCGVDFLYEITPDYLREYAPEPTPLDQEDIQDLRVDISEVSWDASKSAAAAATKILFS